MTKRDTHTSRLLLACGVTVALGAGFLVAAKAPAQAQAADWRPAVQREKSVPGRDFTPRLKAGSRAAGVLRSAPAVSWPAAGTAEVAPAAAPAKAGGLPVWVGASRSGGHIPQRVRVELLDASAADKLGSSGPVLTVRRAGAADPADVPAELAAPDRATVGVDYSAFRHAYGGDWATRLSLVELPSCALSTPDIAACRTGRPLAAYNDVKGGRISADLALTTDLRVLALTAAPAGSAGDYKATKLSASSSWQAGGSGGDFAWRYGMGTPNAQGGPEPDLDLTYSSGSIDGRVASTNNQSSWVGDGWDLTEGYIERRYKSCYDDVATTPKPQDLCWETDNAYLSLDGKSVELIKDDATGAWHPRDDDGSRVERLTGAVNGDDNGEHWRVTRVDGTQFYFGLNRLPGWANGNEETSSTWTVPVFGNDLNEPCHGATFAASYCVQAWRWNLDYVVDPHGDAMSYTYSKETNYYGRNLTASAGTAYVRGGWLRRIDYGLRSSTMYSQPATGRVNFGVQERCAAGATCGSETITKDTAKNWPDVPYDQNCNQGATCTGLFAPTFWTRKRLASVTAQLWLSGTTYRDVESWALGYQFRDPGDGTSPILWLASVTDTGKVGGTLTPQPITFEGIQLENRVDALEGIPAMFKWRLTDIYDESGGHLRVNYSAKECTRSALPAPESNTKLCFPLYWQADGGSSLTLDWFHKYVAVQVLEDDQAGVAGIEETNYAYLSGAAWHYDDNDLTPAKYRTWGLWRGFGKVRTMHGSPGTTQSQSDTLYLRGMHGDKLPNGTRSVSVTDSQGGTVTDHLALTGFARETITYSGAGGSVLSGEISDAWLSAPTATRGSVKAYQVGVAVERGREAITGGWRATETRTSFDAYGLPTLIDDLGDTSIAADDKCTRTTYARNTSAWLIAYPVRAETVGVACTSTPSYPANAISDQRTFYDGSTTFGTAPIRGDRTLTQEVTAYNAGSPEYAQVARVTYDQHGRIRDTFDALDRKSSVAYTPATGGPVTGTTNTNELGWVTTTTLEPAFNQPTLIVDANGRKTETTYDPLGRTTAVWLSDRLRANQSTPNYKFSYLIRTDAPSVVTSEEIRDDGGYESSYVFYDGQLRERQTQVPAPDGGRVVTDTFYDSRGLAYKVNDDYWNSGAAGTTLLAGVTDNTVPAQTVSLYDGAEREIAEMLLSYGTEQWRTTTAYGGDRVTVDPPAGAPATMTITDADDRVVQLRHYPAGSPTGSYDTTSYTYTKAGQQETATDPAGTVWRHTYDVRGREIEQSDPDKGVTRFTYDAADQVKTSTDARNVTLAFSYDALGRKTGMFEGSTSGPKRIDWKYDTLSTGVVVKGQAASATRYVPNASTGGTDAYVNSVDAYDVRYRALVTTVTIPAIEGALQGSYRINTSYTATGLPATVSYPAAGGLPAETLRFTYDTAGRLQSAQTGLGTLLTAASYTPFGEPAQFTLSAAAGKELARTYFYDSATRRLARTMADRSTSPQHLADVNYTYDPSGNITKVADTPMGGASDVQCFGYDGLRRLTSAWTATDGCVSAPSSSVIGGPAAYWQSWSHDKIGNRLTETNFNPSTGTSATSTYAYPATGAARPHALASVTTAGLTDTYGYDAAGNTHSRLVKAANQALTWDAEGNLERVTDGGSVTSFVYDADGDRLLRRDPTGTTLYLGDTELRLSGTSAVTGTRTYAIGDTVAVRTLTGLSFEVTDPHGTATIAVNAADLAATQRRYLPFGQLRSAAPGGWPDQKGFVGGTDDPSTGLVHLGAREYDPATGRFISVDPIVDFDDPQQMNPYAYANNTPISAADADGEKVYFCDGCNRDYSPKKKAKAKPKPHKKIYFCDGCNRTYHRPKPKAQKRIYFCDGCNRKYSPPKKKKIYFCDGCNRKYKTDPKAHARYVKEQQRLKERSKPKNTGGCRGFWGCVGHGIKKGWDSSGGKVVHGARAFGEMIGRNWRAIATVGVGIVAAVAGTACIVFSAGLCGTVIGAYLVSAGIGAAAGTATYGLTKGPHTTKGWIGAGLVGALTGSVGKYTGRVAERATGSYGSLFSNRSNFLP